MDARRSDRQSSEPKISHLRRGRWAGVAPCAFVLTLGAIVVWKLWPRDGLLDRAEKIADVRDWTGIEYMTGRGPLYNWLTENDVLFFRQDPGKSDLQGYRQTVLPTGKAQSPIKVPGLTVKALTLR